VSPSRSIGIFLGLTVLLDAPFWVLLNATQAVTAATVAAMMWMPGRGGHHHLPNPRTTAAQPRTGHLERAVRPDRLLHSDRLLPGFWFKRGDAVAPVDNLRALGR